MTMIDFHLIYLGKTLGIVHNRQSSHERVG